MTPVDPFILSMPINPNIIGRAALHTPQESATPRNLRDVESDEELRMCGRLIASRSQQIRVMRHSLGSYAEVE